MCNISNLRAILACAALAALLAMPAVAAAEGGDYLPKAGILVGVAYGYGGLQFAYGLSFGYPRGHWFLRFEGRGTDYLRAAAGVTASSGPDVVASERCAMEPNPSLQMNRCSPNGEELASVQGSHLGVEIGVVAHLGGPGKVRSAFGLHTGAGFGTGLYGILAQGTVPIVGDHDNWEVSTNLAGSLGIPLEGFGNFH